MTTHIKINNVPPKIQYTADGTQTVFEFPFAIFSEDNIQIYIDSVKQNISTYTVTKTDEGGSVTFNEVPAQGKVITIRRELDIERTSDFQEGGALRADVLNDELDYQIACQQQIADALNRTMVLPPYIEETGLDLTLPLPDHGKAIVWNADGTNLENSTVEINALESTLRDYKNVAEAEAAVACEKAAVATSKATVAANAAQQAAATATVVAAAVEGFAHAHSNCITGIPQNINLMLSDGTLTLKSGSIITAPDGTQLQITSDKTYVQSQTREDGQYAVFVSKSSGNIQGPIALSKISSGLVSNRPEWSSSISGNIYYTTDTNKICLAGASAWNEDWGVALPIAIVTLSSSVIASIDQVFNGAGYIGHHAFVLPGMKYLIPNGVNEDGTLRSTSVEQTQLYILELDRRGNCAARSARESTSIATRINLGSFNDFSELPADVHAYYYIAYLKNINQHAYKALSNDWQILENRYCTLFTYNYDETIVTKFNVEPVVSMATVKMLDTKAGLKDNNVFMGTNTVSTPATTNNSQQIANTEFVKNAIESANSAPRDITVLWGDGNAVTNPSQFTLSEDFMNFEKIGIDFGNDSRDSRTIYIQDTYWLNKAIERTNSSSANSKSVLLCLSGGNVKCDIYGYYHTSTPSTHTKFVVAAENGSFFYIYGINRKSNAL